MPSFRKLCAHLCCLRPRNLHLKPQHHPQVQDQYQDYTSQLVTTDKTATSVSDLESEKMTEIISTNDNSEDEQHRNATHNNDLSPRTRHHAVDLFTTNQSSSSGARRSHGLLTPHASTGDAYAEDTNAATIYNSEDVATQRPQATTFNQSRETSTEILYHPPESDGELSFIEYASVGVQTSRSYVSSRSRTSTSSVSRGTQFHPSPSSSSPSSLHHPSPRSRRTSQRPIWMSSKDALAATSAATLRHPHTNHTNSPPKPSKPSPKATHQIPKKKPSFVLQGEHECKAVLDDLKYLKSERLRLFAELRRVVDTEKDLMSLFWTPQRSSVEPLKLDEVDDVKPEDNERSPTAAGDDGTGNDSLEYVSLTSDEERRLRVRFEADRQSQPVIFHENQQKDRPELPELTAAVPAATRTQRFEDSSPPPPSQRSSNRPNRSRETTPHTPHQRIHSTNNVADHYTTLVPAPNSAQASASASTYTSNGLGPAFTFGEGTGTSIAGTLSLNDRGRARSFISFEEELGPPPIRDPDSYYIWFDLETNDATRPASNTRILEVAICITDKNFMRLDNGVSYIVHWPLDANFIASEMPDKVRAMHEKSGLLEAYANTPQQSRLTLAQVEQHVCRYLKKHDVQPTGRGIMAGAGIAFDRGMVRQHMKTLDKYFGHQIFDTSSVWQLVKRKYSRGQRFQEQCAHRALEDIYGSMREARMFSETVLKAPRDVSWPSTRGR